MHNSRETPSNSEPFDWRLGTMGFSYSDWAGVFYPKGTRAGDYLAYFAKHFNAVELDTTFYATPPPERVARWAETTPDDFRFTVKAPRLITHDLALDRAIEPMLDFLKVMLEFRDKLGVVLLQFPPGFTITEFPRLGDFLAALPRRFRYAVEFRHPSWRTPRTAELLTQYRACWVSVDYVHEKAEVRPTTDFLYIRWIGEHDRFYKMDHEQIDETPRLEWWRDQILKQTGTVGSVYGFFNNDYAGYSIETCNRFKRLTNLPVSEPPADDTQGQLFG